MRVSDLIGRKVRTSDGVRLGRAFDVEVARSGPRLSDVHEHSLEVTRLFVGSQSFILRLGFHRRDMQGPMGVRFLARHLRGYIVAWNQVEEVGDDMIVLSSPLADVEELEGET